MSKTVLFSTVGGSSQPILTAIRETAPDFVVFFCTTKGKGRAGSMDQVIGDGLVVKADSADPKPTLASISTQAGLGADQFEALEVPPDDFDGAFLSMRKEIEGRRHRDPHARLVADYTGGTKSMAVALFVAAVETGVELQLVAGLRTDVHVVRNGTEGVIAASVDRLRVDRVLNSHLKAWKHFGFEEAATGLATIRPVADSPDLPRVRLALLLSRAFARWDKFDHAQALELLTTFGREVSDAWPSMMSDVGLLGGRDRDTREPARLFDLWRNAERRAAQGRYDDAVARWYRLVEWTAQWQLKVKLGINTANYPHEKLPPGLDEKPDATGQIKLGLSQAWQVAGHQLGDPVRTFVAESGGELRNLLELRNNSILAHGDRPVAKQDWDSVRGWVEGRFLRLLGDLAREAGLKSPPAQLPTEAPESVLRTP